MKGFPIHQLNEAVILEDHFHNSELTYGNATNFVGADTPVKFTVIGGDNAWGTELHIHDGTVIGGGLSTKYMDVNTLYIVSASTANKISVIEFLTGTTDAKRTSVVTTDATDLFTLAGHGLVNGDKVLITDVVTTTGVNTYTVYYVISMAGNNFQVSLTSGGAAVVLGTGNGTCSVQKLTQTNLTKCFHSASAVNSDANPLVLKCPRVTCNNRLFVRAKSETGSTISIGFLLGLHLYNA